MDEEKMTYGTYVEGGTGKGESFWIVNEEYRVYIYDEGHQDIGSLWHCTYCLQPRQM